MKITGLLLLFFFFRAFHWAHAKNPLTVLVDVIHGKTLKNGFLVLKNLIYYKSCLLYTSDAADDPRVV